jgi:pectate lyase
LETALKTTLLAAGILLASHAHAATLDAKSFVGASTPLQIAQYGIRNYSAPVLVSGLHDPANFAAAPKLPTWQFAQVDPTGGVLTFERQSAPATGWHAWTRSGKVLVTGGGSATADRVYTVFNGQQLVAALNQAGNEPKIVRVVGHIDLRWSQNNTVFSEYTSYSDQKYGGSIALPSNTTLVGINDAQGRPARITGTAILIGGELALAAGGDPEADFKKWIADGKKGDDYPTWTRNVIVRNIALDTPWDVNPEDAANAYADGITVSRGQNIYLDHITISDGDTPDTLAVAPWLTRHDGALDVVRGSDYVTIANSTFNKHHKTTLIGNGDSGRAWSDEGRMHVTLSGNWWDGATTRLPLNRYGQVHMFNNLVTGSVSTKDVDVKFESGTDARYHSNMLIENHYYNIVGLKLTEFCGKAIKGKDFTGFRSSGHIFTSDKAGTNLVDGQCGYAPPPTASLWTPPYLYALQTATSTLTAVPANAGAGKLK